MAAIYESGKLIFLSYKKWDLRSSGLLRSVEWQFRTDVPAQFTGAISKGQAVQMFHSSWIGCAETVGITILRCITTQKSADLINMAAEACSHVLPEASTAILHIVTLTMISQ